MGPLSTDVFLGGLTTVIGGFSLIAAIWLSCEIVRECRRTKFFRQQTPENLRIATGIALRALGIAVIFLMRLPLRAMREAHNNALGTQWLEWSVYWETPASLVLSAGILMIMWPAIRGAAPNQAVAIVGVGLAGVGLFFAGVFFILALASSL